MDKLQGGDWNSFFHKFEAVASQSTANVARPSIVDDNVPLPIIRGHHFDIAYQETVDELVKCQVCGMLLRRAMFAAHLHQRHAELCPPSMSTDDDSGRHSGLESPDISRNPNFPFSPKLMSPSIDKDSTELAPIMKSDRKSKRRKARRERRTENESSTPKDDTVYSSPRIDPSYDDRLLSRFDDRASASAQRLRTRRDRRTYNEPNTAKDDTVHSSSKIDTSYNDRFLSQFDDRAGTSSQDLRSNFLGVLASTSRHTKAVSESCEGDDNLISRLSPSIDSVPIAHAEREESSFKKKERKSRRRTRKREHIFPSSIRSRILPVVKPINLDLASDINLVQDTSVCGQYSTNDLRDAVKGTSQSGTEVAETCSYANVRKDSKKRAPLDTTLVHSTSQSLEKFAAFQNASVQLSVTVGQPAERAKPESDGIIPHIHDVSTIFSPPQLIYSQSQISYESAFIPNYKVGSNQRATGNDSLLHSEIVPSHSILKTSPVLEFESEKVLGAKSSEHCKIPDDEQNQRLLSPQKLKLFTNYQEYWKSLGVKCTAYDVVLPVVSRQDDADDATVAFLTSSPEPLSDDNCDVKEEMEEYQDRLVSDETYQSRISRYRVRQTQWISSGSSDTDQSIIVEEADSHCIANDLDDDDVRELSLEFASLSQTYQQQENANINEDIEYGTEISARLMDNNSARICNVPPPSTSRFAVENSKKCIQSEELVENLACQPSTYPSLLDETFNSLMVNRYILDSKQTQKIAEMPRITPRAPNLEVKDGLSLKEGIRVCSQQPELEMGVPIIERTPSQVSRTDANSIGVGDDNISDFFVDAPNAPQKRSREDGSSYDEDYSAEDEELVSLHENSSNYPIFLQQSGHKQLLQQPGPFFITQRVGTYESNPALARELMQSDLPREQKILQEECRKSLWSGLERPELRIQTMFEDNYSVPIQHSEPNLRSSTSTKEASYKFYERDPIEIESSLQQRKYTSHSFPSRRSREYNEVNNAVQVNRYQVQPNKGLPSRDECPVVSNGILSSHEIIPEEQGLLLHHHVPYERYEGFPKMPKHPHLLLDTREHQCNTNQTIQQTSSFIPIKRKESVGFPLNGCQNVSQQNLCYQDQLGDNTLHKQFPREEFQVFQQEKPLELMEEEMKAMRYIYLKNEQRIAKKSLAESDSRLRKNVVSPVNLMLLSQLPSIQVEPTAIPEGVSRKRMQEQILPPFYHAQFSVRNGPSVSPVNYDDVNNETDAEIQILHEVMNLELLEPPMMRPVLSKNLIEPLRDKSAPQDYQQEVALELLQPFDPRLEESRFTNQYIPTSDIGSETDMSFDESFCSYNKESSEECSDDSTDSETIRRRWDLSPSVSPLTLEAFASGLSSPDGSDSSDGQSDVPVWSTMSRKHAKIALAVCRTMPKRLQPLCRRFAWQQGITYLLENFCLQKWEIREEHDTESVWFFDKGVRRFKPFDKVPWDIPGCDETSKSDINVFYGFNICADIPIKRCRKTIRIEDRANVSLHCKEIEKTINVAKDAKFEGSRGSTNSFDDDSDSSDSYTSDSTTSITPSVVHSVSSPKELSYEQQEFIAISCCKQFLQQMVARKKGKPFITTGRSAVYVTSILAELFREHRSAYELMIADIIPLPTPDQREIPFSDDAEWVATRILAINRAQNRLIIPSFPPWAAMHRMWKVYGPVQQLASVIGGEFEKFVNECISVAYNHYYRLKNGIKVADRIPGDLLELCFAITSERMREHIESVEAAKSKSETKKKSSRIRVPLKRREKLSSFVSQQTANHDLLKCCRRIYDEKRQTKRRRWNAMRYLHNALPGAVIEGIDVFDMAQRTNLSVAGIFGPEHKLKLNDLPFASEMDNRPAYLDMEELLNLMDHTLAIQSDITVDHEGNLQPVIDFLTVRGLQFKAIMGSDRCHLMVSPAPIPVPPVTVDRYGNMTSTQRAFVPYSLYPEFISQKMHGHSHEQFFRPLESPPACDDDNEIFDDIQCPGCLWTTEDRVDMDFAQTCLKGLPRELLQQITIAKIDTARTTYASYKDSEIMTEADLINLMVNESES